MVNTTICSWLLEQCVEGNTNYDCAWQETVKPLSASIMCYLVCLRDACPGCLTEDRYRPNCPAATRHHGPDENDHDMIARTIITTVHTPTTYTKTERCHPRAYGNGRARCPTAMTCREWLRKGPRRTSPRMLTVHAMQTKMKTALVST